MTEKKRGTQGENERRKTNYTKIKQNKQDIEREEEHINRIKHVRKKTGKKRSVLRNKKDRN